MAKIGQNLMKRKQQPATQPRTCLSCGEVFPSLGADNRVCQPCKHTQQAQATPEPVYEVALRPMQ
jgi:hypothetical protein